MNLGGGGKSSTGSSPAFGTGTNPAVSYTIASTGDDLLFCLFYVPVNIIITKAWGFSSSNGTVTGDNHVFHLMKYDFDFTNGNATSGDLTNGKVIADHTATIADATNAAIDSLALTVDTKSQLVTAGQVVMGMTNDSGSGNNANTRLEFVYYYE